MNVFEMDEVGICEGIHPDDKKQCKQPLHHPVATCEVCGSRVTWVQSIEKWEREQKLAPKDNFGIALLEHIRKNSRLRGTMVFKDAEQLKLWNIIIERLPEQRIRDIVNECGKTRRGYGWRDYVINKCRVDIEHDYQEPEELDDDVEYIP